MWDKFNEWFLAVGYKEQREYTATNGSEFEEIRAALNGASVSVVRVNKKKEVIVAVAGAGAAVQGGARCTCTDHARRRD